MEVLFSAGYDHSFLRGTLWKGGEAEDAGLILRGEEVDETIAHHAVAIEGEAGGFFSRRQPFRIKGEEVDHDHAEGEIGEIDEDDEPKMHREKSEPNPGAGFAKESEGKVKEFGEEGSPSHDAEKPFGETEDEIPE